MKHVLLALMALMAFAGAPASAQDIFDLPLEEPYVQAASGMAFPLRVGPFERLTTGTRFSADGSDESVGYRMRGKYGDVNATIYVYPSPSLSTASTARAGIDAARRDLCAMQFAGVMREIASVHPTATLVEEEATTLIQRGISFQGRKLAFTISGPSAFGKEQPPLRSEAYLFCYVGGRWNVKYRFTYPDAIDANVSIAAFMRDLTWTIAPEQL